MVMMIELQRILEIVKEHGVIYESSIQHSIDMSRGEGSIDNIYEVLFLLIKKNKIHLDIDNEGNRLYSVTRDLH